jgi:hypothetical protein
MSSLPKSLQNARKAYAGGSQYVVEAPKITASPPRYSKSHLARSGSSSPSHTAHYELRASSSTPSPVQEPQDGMSVSGPPSSPPEKSELARLRSDTLGNGLNASISRSQSPGPWEGWAADYLPAGFKVLPKSCYNYEPFEPPPPPPVVPCSRAWLYSQIVSTSRPVFLSCNLTNPIHLASAIAFGQKWSVTEEVAGNMTPAMSVEYMDDFDAWKGVFGVLVCGLTPHAMDLLEAVRGREDGYERIVEDVAVKVEDSDAMTVAAYVYRKSPSRLA